MAGRLPLFIGSRPVCCLRRIVLLLFLHTRGKTGKRGIVMKQQPEISAPSKNGPSPEIVLPGSDRATNVIPDEVPRRDGPGGEPGGTPK